MKLTKEAVYNTAIMAFMGSSLVGGAFMTASSINNAHLVRSLGSTSLTGGSAALGTIYVIDTFVKDKEETDTLLNSLSKEELQNLKEELKERQKTK